MVQWVNMRSQKTKSIFLAGLPAIIIATLLVVAIIYAWSEPSQPPPGGNVPAPLNVGPSGQSKEGGLILNTGGAAIGLIVATGTVGIGTTSPGARLDVNGAMIFRAISQPSLSLSDQVVMYLDPTTKDLRISINGQPYVSLVSGATSPSKVTGLAAAGSGTQIALSWSVPNNGGKAITGYRVYRGTTSGGEIYLTTTASNSFTDSGLDTTGTTYYYKVSAVNSIGESPLSDEAAGTFTLSCYCDSDGDTHYTSSQVTRTATRNTCSYVAGCRATPAGDDCDDGCGTCYPGSTAVTTWADGRDQDCNGVTDNTRGGGTQCQFTDANYPINYYQADNRCRAYCGSIGYNWKSTDCLTGRGPAISQPSGPADLFYSDKRYYGGFDIFTCTRSALTSVGLGADSCLFIPMPTNVMQIQCSCEAYQ